MINQDKVLHSPFNVYIHARTFIHYTEVIIHPTGKVEYAIPSHVEKLFEIFAKHRNISIDEAKQLMWHDLDYLEIMMKETGCIFVWYDSICNLTNLTKQQLKKLSLLLKYRCISDDVLQDIQNFAPFDNKYDLMMSLRNKK